MEGRSVAPRLPEVPMIEPDSTGQFLARKRAKRQRRSAVLASAFDDDKPYELTEIG